MKKVILNANMGSKVLERLREFTALPQSGYVAGQAVASAVSELFGDKNFAVVYNDVDVFRPVSGAEEEEHRAQVREYEEKRESGEVAYSGPLNNLCSFTAPEHYLDQYAQLQFACLTRYEVRKTYRSGMLNEIACSEMPVTALALLQTFDINSAQVAVDLETGRMEWTPAFEKFMETGRLDITSLHTPFHSLVRYFRKLRELSGVTGNRLRIIEMVAMAYQLGRVRNPASPTIAGTFNLRWKFGELYKAKFDEVADELLPFFEVMEATGKNGKIYTLKPRFDASPELGISSAYGHFHIVHDLPLISRALQEDHGHGLKETFAYLATVKGASFARECWFVQGDSYVTGKVTSDQVRQLDEFLTTYSHFQGRLAELDLASQWEKTKSLQAESDRRGVWVYGVAEGAEDWNWEQEFVTRFFEEAAVEAVKPLKTSPLPHLSIGTWNVKELTTGMEVHTAGFHLKRCMTGYPRAMENGGTALISIQRGDAPADHTVLLELCKWKNGWSEHTFYGKEYGCTTAEEREVADIYISRYNVAYYFGKRAQVIADRLPKKWTRSMISMAAAIESRTVGQFANSLRNKLLTGAARKLGLPNYYRGESWHFHYPVSFQYWKIAVCGEPARKENDASATFSDLSDDIPF